MCSYKLGCYDMMSASRINKDKGKKKVWRHSAKMTDLSFTLGLVETNQSSFRHHRMGKCWVFTDRTSPLGNTMRDFLQLFPALWGWSNVQTAPQYIHSHAFTCARQSECVRISGNSNNRIVWLWPMLPRRQAPWICDERREIREQRWRQSERQTWQRHIVQSRQSKYHRGQQLRLSPAETWSEVSHR